MWSVKSEVWNVECDFWSVTCAVWSVCDLWSVQFGECGVKSAQCRVWWSVECRLLSVECGVYIECGAWRVECKVWSGGCRVRLYSVECTV